MKDKKLTTIIIIIILILLVIFFFPKTCGGVGSTGGPEVTYINCPCIGIKADSPMNKYVLDFSAKACYGICLKSKCETNTDYMFPPN